METLSGIVREDIIFKAGDEVNLTGNVQIAEGYTVEFSSGSIVKSDAPFLSIEVFGSLIISGSEQNLVDVHSVDISGKEGGVISIDQAYLNSSSISTISNSAASLNITNSVIDGGSFSSGSDSVTSKNIFNNTYVTLDNSNRPVLDSNTFVGNSTIYVEPWDSFGIVDSSLTLTGNNFLSSSTPNIDFKNNWSGIEYTTVASDNYWGSSELSFIDNKIHDGNDDLNINGVIDLSGKSNVLSNSAPLKIGEHYVDLDFLTLSSPTDKDIVIGEKLASGDVNYTGGYDEYVVAKVDGGFSVRQPWVSSETDKLQDVDRIHFSDFSVAFDIEGIAGKVYRVYKAAFDRSPDMEGLGAWINAMDQGLTLDEVSRFFIESEEFRQLYGADVSNEGFVTALYNNVLDRDPDSSGFEAWTNILNEGTYSKEQALSGFSESVENKEAVSGLIENGIVYDLWG